MTDSNKIQILSKEEELEITNKVRKLEISIPQNREMKKPTDLLVVKILRTFEVYGKEMSPKEVSEIFPKSESGRERKWFCDKLWNLKEKGFLESPSHGYYIFPKKVEVSKKV